jgi:hypothetical protein
MAPACVADPPAPRIRGIGAITGWGEGAEALPLLRRQASAVDW